MIYDNNPECDLTAKTEYAASHLLSLCGAIWCEASQHDTPASEYNLEQIQRYIDEMQQALTHYVALRNPATSELLAHLNKRQAERV